MSLIIYSECGISQISLNEKNLNVGFDLCRKIKEGKLEAAL